MMRLDQMPIEERLIGEQPRRLGHDAIEDRDADREVGGGEQRPTGLFHDAAHGG